MEKLRLVAKEIRALTCMCSAPLRNVPDNVIAMNENDQTSRAALDLLYSAVEYSTLQCTVV